MPGSNGLAGQGETHTHAPNTSRCYTGQPRTVPEVASVAGVEFAAAAVAAGLERDDPRQPSPML